ncbi:hypothetical protein NWE73_08800 [Bdellovibrio sp. PAP01]|uniref:Uncharacterized protein n=2 Tax=Bdellovibrio svalbardensis TaxID=2972972 RepID=A0ABT6DIW7_9BACT|nr:hypothetical protein [Bdellovibrio svalbardensis]
MMLALTPDLPTGGLFEGLTFKESFAVTSSVSAIVKGSAKDGSFLNNFYDFYINDYGMSLGFAAAGTVLPNAIPEVYDYVKYPIYAIGAASWYSGYQNVNCDPKTGGDPRSAECRK